MFRSNIVEVIVGLLDSLLVAHSNRQPLADLLPDKKLHLSLLASIDNGRGKQCKAIAISTIGFCNRRRRYNYLIVFKLVIEFVFGMVYCNI